MPQNDAWKPREVLLAFLAIALVLFLQEAIPFLMMPTLGQAIWTTGFAQSMAKGPLFDLYAHDFGIPKPAAIAFGLAGALPTSLLIRLGLDPADAYSAMAMAWLGLAMTSAYLIGRRFGGTRSIALLGAVTWMTMPVIWAHAGYSMLSLGISLLPFYFLSALRLFLIGSQPSRITPSAIATYVIATIVAAFMDGYTFMMFATGASILLVYSFWTRAEDRWALLRIALPVHVVSFSLAYVLYALYIGKSQFSRSPLESFRGWGLDLSYVAIPTRGMLWLPDALGLSIGRSNDLHFGDASVWVTTFALPVLVVGLVCWWRARRQAGIATGVLLVAIFAFYMALGPSLKINSTKPEDLQRSQPREQSVMMAPEYALVPTGNAWMSQLLPGFNVMRASYRWSALGIFALWLLIIIYASRADRREARIWSGLLVLLILLNLPDMQKRWDGGLKYRAMFHQIDEELVGKLAQLARKNETLAFVPWRNDFMANYLAPKIGFRTFNVGGDKNLAAAQAAWPEQMLAQGGEFDANKAMASVKMLIDGTADAIVLPYFDMAHAAHAWPCANGKSSPDFLCPPDRKAVLEPVVATLRALPYVAVADTDLFAMVRLRPEFLGQANRLELNRIIAGSIRYPIVIEPGFAEAPYVLQGGWHVVEDHHVWSKSEARLLLPRPQGCADGCEAELVFVVFGASPERPVDVSFASDEQSWKWSAKVTATSSDAITLDVPLSGADDFRRISISIPDATSPQRLLGSTDSRILGISLQRIELLKPQ